MNVITNIKWRHWALAIVGAGVALGAIIGFTAALFSAVASRDNNATLAVIKDCTEVGGQCNERNQKATADVVFNINRVSIYAAACASRTENKGNISKVQTCVLNRIQEDRNNNALREGNHE